jgi:ribonuclease BN (tRNA processing enzyme)
VKRRHSTTEEALEVAAASGAYRTVLTHFSQRYPKIPAGIAASGGCCANLPVS